MRKFIEQMGYGECSQRDVYSAGRMPDMREGQTGWIEKPLGEVDLPRSLKRLVESNGYEIAKR